MLDTEAAVARAVLVRRLFKQVEDRVVCLVADGVNCDLKAGAIGIHDVLVHLALGNHLVIREAAGIRRVEVRREK